MIVLLGDVYLRLRWNDNRPSDDHPENGKEKFHLRVPWLSVNTDTALQEVASAGQIDRSLADALRRNDPIYRIRMGMRTPVCSQCSQVKRMQSAMLTAECAFVLAKAALWIATKFDSHVRLSRTRRASAATVRPASPVECPEQSA